MSYQRPERKPLPSALEQKMERKFQLAVIKVFLAGFVILCLATAGFVQEYSQKPQELIWIIGSLAAGLTISMLLILLVIRVKNGLKTRELHKKRMKIMSERHEE